MSAHDDAPLAPRTDLITAAVFLAFGSAIIIACLRMPTFTDQGTPIYVAPGLVPGFHGVVLCVLALVLGGRSLSRGLATQVGRSAYSRTRTLLAIALTAVFEIGLIGRVPFWLASALFVFVFIVAFEWPLARPAVQSGIAAAIALAAGIGITVLFQTVFLIRMP